MFIYDQLIYFFEKWCSLTKVLLVGILKDFRIIPYIVKYVKMLCLLFEERMMLSELLFNAINVILFDQTEECLPLT